MENSPKTKNARTDKSKHPIFASFIVAAYNGSTGNKGMLLHLSAK